MKFNYDNTHTLLLIGDVSHEWLTGVATYQIEVPGENVIMISSPGGDPSISTAIINYLSCKETTFDKVIANSECSSAAADIFLSFPVEKRFAHENTRFMLHLTSMEGDIKRTYYDAIGEAEQLKYHDEILYKHLVTPKCNLKKVREIFKESKTRDVDFLVKQGWLLKRNIIR